MSKLTLIIVNYNSSKNTNKLLLSIKKKLQKLIDQIIIVDNNSRDIKDLDLKDQNIKLIKNKKNFGFAKAVNQGINLSKSEIILLLNPDTTIIDDSLLKTYQLISQDKQIGVAGGKIKYKNKKIYSASTNPNFLVALFEFTNLKKIFPNNPFTLNFWPESNKIIKKPIEVSGLCAAYFFFKKFDQKGKLNLFSQNYFLYLEDLDFCLSMIKKGFKVVFDPRSQVFHLGGASSQNKHSMALNHWYKSRKIFFKKHLNKIEGIILQIIFTLEEFLLKARNTLIKND